MNTKISTHILHRDLLPQQRESEKETILNNDILNSTLNCVERETADSIAQPHLFIGAPGSGKTHLLRRIESRIQMDCGRSLQPIFIEGRTIFTTDDIWKQGAELSRRLVLLIDNIQYYFERTSNTDHFEFRGRLNKSGAPIIIATSDKMLPAFADYNAAFFDAFKTSYLRPLSAQDIKTLIGNCGCAERVEKLMNYMPKTPRSVFTAMNVIEKSNAPELDLVFLIDFFSTYYQSRYDELPTQIQKILSTLSQDGEGLTLREIRDKIGLDNGKLSPYLKIMVDRNLVGKTAQTQRGGTYRISDPLFGLWARLNVTNLCDASISSVFV